MKAWSIPSFRNHYRITDKTARFLSERAGKSLPAIGSAAGSLVYLPSGRAITLFTIPYISKRRKWCWCIHSYDSLFPGLPDKDGSYYIHPWHY